MSLLLLNGCGGVEAEIWIPCIAVVDLAVGITTILVDITDRKVVSSIPAADAHGDAVSAALPGVEVTADHRRIHEEVTQERAVHLIAGGAPDRGQDPPHIVDRFPPHTDGTAPNLALRLAVLTEVVPHHRVIVDRNTRWKNTGR